MLMKSYEHLYVVIIDELCMKASRSYRKWGYIQKMRYKVRGRDRIDSLRFIIIHSFDYSAYINIINICML